MAVRTVAELLAELSTGGSAYNHIETKLVVDIIDTLNSLVGDAASVADLAAGTAIIVLPTVTVSAG